MALSYSEDMTFDNLMVRMLSAVPDIVDKREGSIIYDALAPAAAELANCYRELDVVLDETFVDTCSLEYLMRRCSERGVPIKGATAAVISGSFTPAELELTAGLRFNCGDQNYILTEKLAPGSYKLTCEETGAAGNQYSGFLLPIQYVEGLETAEIAGVLIPGDDGDDTESLRQRYMESLESQAFGGNVADYKAKIKLLPGVGGVKVKRTPAGGGTVGITIIDSSFNPPTQTLVDQIQTAVDPEQNHGDGVGFAPIGHTVTVTGVQASPIRVSSTITFASGWDAETAQATLEKTVSDYLLSLREEWEDAISTVVRISQIESRLLNVDPVLDITDTKINGVAKNLELAGDEVPVLQELVVT